MTLQDMEQQKNYNLQISILKSAIRKEDTPLAEKWLEEAKAENKDIWEVHLTAKALFKYCEELIGVMANAARFLPIQ
ncbi:hypothetical protein FACS1894188_10500 [Clostridia bacterium]|nr:hypothetical protein FACS1894188_10500 [Clostridia bacterium]